MEERRQHIRISDSLKVVYQVLKSFRSVTSNTRDISEGGIRLPILQRLQPGMVIELELHLPDLRKPIRAIGEIVWLKEIEDLKFPFVVGVKFINIDTVSLGKIRDYIKEKSHEGYIGWI